MKTDRRGFLSALFVAPFVRPAPATPAELDLPGFTFYPPLTEQGIRDLHVKRALLYWNNKNDWLVPHPSELYYTKDRD